MVGVIGLTSGCGSAAATVTNESKSFDAPADRLVISADYDLSVATHSGDTIEVERQVPEAWNPTTTLQGDTLELRVDRPKVNFGADAEADVLVPEGLALEVRMPNADLEGADLADGLTVHKSNGDVLLTDVSGTVDVTMTNGDIDLSASEPLDELRLRTKNGDIVARLGGTETYDVSADTVNGEVAVDVPKRKGADRTIDASNTNGDITIKDR